MGDPKLFDMLIGGDWNYISPGDARHYLGDPAAVFKGLNAKQIDEPIINRWDKWSNCSSPSQRTTTTHKIARADWIG
eukprot:5897603-Karenia_brevis.AAC.1